MKQKLVIWGAGGHALVVADIIGLRQEYEIYGFLDDVNPERHNTDFCGLAILGGDEQLDNLKKSGVKYLILGFGDNKARLKLSKRVIENSLQLAKAIHPGATIAKGVSVGAGSVICAGVVIAPGSKIGENVIVNTCASINHECIVEDGAHIGPQACLGGRTKVGKGAWVGIGATVKDRVLIGEYSIIGAGSVVLENIPKGVLAYGLPARVAKEI